MNQNITKVAVPAAVLQTAIDILGKMPWKDVGQLMPELLACMTQENIVPENKERE